MQISKTLVAVCAGVAGVVAVSVYANDNDAQAKAREALRQKMAELQSTQQVAPAAPVAPTAPAAPARPAAPVAAPAPAAPAQPAAPAVTQQPTLVLPPAADPELIAKARAALRQKIATLNGQQAQAPTLALPPAANEDAIARARTALRAKMAEIAATEPGGFQQLPPDLDLPKAADPALIAKAREAVRQKINEMETRQAPVIVQTPKPEKKPSQVAKVEPKPAAPKNPDLAAPAPAVADSKREQLSQLLVKYRADEISPEQYHTERARILAAN